MKRLFALLGILLLLGGILVGSAAAWAWRLLETPFGDSAALEFEIRPGESARQILDRLERLGALRDATVTRLYLVHVLEDPPLQAGEYLLQRPATPPEVLAHLIDGNVVLHSVTIIEGLTLEETALHLANQGFGDEAAFLAAMRTPDLIADLDSEATSLEGYLFPDTYSFPRTVTEAGIVRSMVELFRRHAAALAPGAPATRELVTLASIVEKEALLDSERPIIAGVYRNRLDRGIGLYADPTIIYALKMLGTWDGDLRRRDLELDSPYNTYRYPGLPPGPICSPGLASLQAAAAPAQVPYLYFVSRNDGTHVFAETLREHNRNVDEWQRRYWQRKRAASSK